MARQYLSEYPGEVKLSESARLNLDIVQENYAFTGVMGIATGLIDVCAAAGNNPNYKTVTPVLKLPQMVGTHALEPIIHGANGATGHAQLADKVVEARKEGTSDDFCGFTVRFNAKPSADFSGTSRTLNSREGFTNGELEPCLRKKIMDALRPVVLAHGWEKFNYEEPHSNPTAAALQRLNIAGAQAQGRPSMFASILASVKKVN